MRFQFLGIPPKGELYIYGSKRLYLRFPISRDPPEGGTLEERSSYSSLFICFQFLGIPPKGELPCQQPGGKRRSWRFQFLGIPPKGEHHQLGVYLLPKVECFQFLGIPPKGEPSIRH